MKAADRDFSENGKGVHLMNDEFTLCGHAFDIAAVEEDLGEFVPPSRRVVTCPRCIDIIDMCRGVRIDRTAA